MAAVTALDTSVIIAGLLSWHDAHARVYPALETALSEEASAVLPVHALIEAYSVMTRLPSPRRLKPEEALKVLSDSLKGSTRVVGLQEDSWLVIEQLASRSLGGGMIYDASILACARNAGATRILTLNGRHFRRLADGDMEVWEPAATEGSGDS